MNIGLWGLDFGSKNLGCAALSYSFLQILNQQAAINKEKLCVIVFTQERCNIDLKYACSIDQVEVVEYHLKDFASMWRLWKNVRKCSIVFDFTAGDSFSDIYGIGRVLKSEFMKTFVIMSGSKLILGPQTYGPFDKELPKRWAKWIFRRSSKIYARDQISADYVKRISGADAECAVDVAFALPYEVTKREDHVMRVGINISGLLWNGGYTKNNQFALKTDYRQYCVELVHWLEQQKAEVHLIGHVLAKEMPVEDDERAARELNAMCGGRCIVGPEFKTPMEAKTYISRMDVFVGARMHSTIAALSAELAVIPFAYSRKFRGLFQSLKYSYLIEATEVSTEDALEKTYDWILRRRELQTAAEKSNKYAKYKLETFESSLKQQICS